MKITVILCTYNRCHSLGKTLESIAASIVSAEWEVLVVDNNSTDRTREVVAKFAARHPLRFRYLFEPQQGKSYALNTGIQNAHCEILAFTDDDVIVEREWLENLTSALHDGQWAGAGGRTLPDWQCSPPRWLRLDRRDAWAPFAVFDLGPHGGPLREAPFGANMAFRRAMFTKYGGFRADLAGSDGLFRNEDIEFGSRLLSAGEKLLYEPSAVGFHPVSRDRLQKQYLLRWWYDKGRADIRAFGIPPKSICFLGIPLRIYRLSLGWTLRWVVAIGSRRRFDCKWRLWATLGAMVECYRKPRRSNRKEELGTVSGAVGD